MALRKRQRFIYSANQHVIKCSECRDHKKGTLGRNNIESRDQRLKTQAVYRMLGHGELLMQRIIRGQGG